MILSVEHFLKDSFPNLVSIREFDIKSVRCYHATRATSKECIIKNGLHLPTVKGLLNLLAKMGVKDVDEAQVGRIIDENGGNIYVHMNKDFLQRNGDYHKKGSEKIRRYIMEISPLSLVEAERNIMAQKGYIFELNLPIDIFDEGELIDCMETGDNLFDNIEEVDITLEVTRNIPPELICAVYEVGP